MQTHAIFKAALTKKQIKFLRKETIRLSGHRTWERSMNMSHDHIYDWSDEVGGLFDWSKSDWYKMQTIKWRIINYKNKLQQNK